MRKQRRNAFSVKQNSSTVHIIKSDERPTRNESIQEHRPLFASSKNKKLPLDPALYKCNASKSLDCRNKTEVFRNKILKEFKKSLGDEFHDSNYYNVEYVPVEDMIKYHPTCMVLDAKVRVLNQNDPPFDNNKIGRLFPRRKMFGHRFAATPKSCVIVSSAGSLFQSNMGQFIGNFGIPLFPSLLNNAQTQYAINQRKKREKEVK